MVGPRGASIAGTTNRRTVLIGSLALAWRVSAAQPRSRVLVVPKLVGIPYYDAVKSGMEEAAGALPALDVIWQGPAQDQVEQQIALIERWLPERPALIAVAADDGVAIGPVLRRAQQAGIHVMAWDSDCSPREFFVNLVDYQEFGDKLVEALARELPAEADIAIVTTSFNAANQVQWINAIKRAMRARERRWRLVDIRPAGESTEQAGRVTRGLLQAYPKLAGLIGLGAPNLPGVARAVREAGLSGKVAVIGNALPDAMREFLLDGTVRSVLLWSARDHGYLMLHCAAQLLRGGLSVGRPFDAGRLGRLSPRADSVNAQVALPVQVFDRDNMDRLRV